MKGAQIWTPWHSPWLDPELGAGHPVLTLPPRVRSFSFWWGSRCKGQPVLGETEAFWPRTPTASYLPHQFLVLSESQCSECKSYGINQWSGSYTQKTDRQWWIGPGSFPVCRLPVLGSRVPLLNRVTIIDQEKLYRLFIFTYDKIHFTRLTLPTTQHL